jgi:two-component system, OmpR family, phosphate regulon response regulator PhoB
MTEVKPAELSILVVDDHERLRNDVAMNLRALGFADIDMASTSGMAQEKMAAKPYDIVFLDWVMPGKSGFTLMEERRQDRACDHIAFVMVTSQTDERRMIDALKAGATGYIIKPVMPDTFAKSIQGILKWIGRMNPRFRDRA